MNLNRRPMMLGYDPVFSPEADPAMWEFAQSGKYKEDPAFAAMTPQQFYDYALGQRGAAIYQREGQQAMEKLRHLKAVEAGFPGISEYEEAIARALAKKRAEAAGNGGGRGMPAWLPLTLVAVGGVYFATR